MDLDMMKQAWSEVNKKLEDQKTLNEQLIIKMTREHTSNRLRPMIYYEIFSIVVLLVLLFMVVYHFNSLDTPISYWSAIGFISCSLFLVTLSSLFLKKAGRIDLQKHTVKEVLGAVVELKSFFFKKRNLEVFISFFIIPFLVTVLIKLWHHKDITKDFHVFAWPLAFGITIGSILTYFVYKYFFEKRIDEMQETLKDLEE